MGPPDAKGTSLAVGGKVMMDCAWCDACSNWYSVDEKSCPVCVVIRERDENQESIQVLGVMLTHAEAEREEARDMAVEMGRCLSNFIYGCECGVLAEVGVKFLQSLVKKASPWIDERFKSGRLHANEPLDGLDL